MVETMTFPLLQPSRGVTVVVLKVDFRSSQTHVMIICSLLQHMCDCGGAEHPLPVPADPRDGPLGEAGLHPHPAPPAGHEQTTANPPVSTSLEL